MHPDLLLVILKLQFLHLTMVNSKREIIINFFNEKISELIQNFPNWEKSQTNMQNILLNPEIVQTRYYQIVSKDIVKLLLISIEKILLTNHTIKHICIDSNNSQCNGCVDELYYSSNVNKIYSFEDEIWLNYFYYKQQSEFYSFDLFMNQKQQMFVDNDMCDDVKLDHFYIHPNFDEKKRNGRKHQR